MKIQGGLRKRGVFQSLLSSPSDLYNQQFPTLQLGWKLGRNSLLALSANLTLALAPPQTPRRALDFSGVLQMQLQQQNRAPESVTSQNSENEKAKSFGSQNP